MLLALVICLLLAGAVSVYLLMGGNERDLPQLLAHTFPSVSRKSLPTEEHDSSDGDMADEGAGLVSSANK